MPTVDHNQWNKWSIASWVVRPLNKDGDMLPTLYGNSLSKKITLVQGIYFLRCNASLINLYATLWNSPVAPSFSWGVVFCGVFGSNETIWFCILCNGPLRKHILCNGSFETPCKITVGLSGSRHSHIWKKAQTLLTKISLMNSIKSRGSKIILWLVATQCLHGRLGLRWTLFLDSPSSCIGPPKVVVVGSSMQLIFQFVPFFLKIYNIYFYHKMVD